MQLVPRFSICSHMLQVPDAKFTVYSHTYPSITTLTRRMSKPTQDAEVIEAIDRATASYQLTTEEFNSAVYLVASKHPQAACETSRYRMGCLAERDME